MLPGDYIIEYIKVCTVKELSSKNFSILIAAIKASHSKIYIFSILFTKLVSHKSMDRTPDDIMPLLCQVNKQKLALRKFLTVVKCATENVSYMH